MKFPDKLTEIMRTRGITAQDIAKQSQRRITVSDVRSFQRGSCPTTYQSMLLSKVFGMDFELLISPPDKTLVPTRQLGISVSEFGKVEAIGKPGAVIKSSKIKNSITRIHDIPKPGELLCSHCFQIDSTCRYNHPEDDIIKFMFGGPGIGGKNPSEIVALHCSKCTVIFDKKPDKNASRLIKQDHALLWSRSIIFTQAMRIAELENK